MLVSCPVVTEVWKIFLEWYETNSSKTRIISQISFDLISFGRSLFYATKSAFTAPKLYWACALASPVTFLTGDHVMQIGFGQISPSASSTRDLGTRLKLELSTMKILYGIIENNRFLKLTNHLLLIAKF